MAVYLRHIDTCLSGYVLDHCNGDNELLLGVPVDGASTHEDVRQNLLNEFRNDSSEKGAHISEEMFRAAVDEQFSTVPDMAAPFDSTLEAERDPDEEGPLYESETCYAWFRVSWDEAE